jgi:hypothetical protein
VTTKPGFASSWKLVLLVGCFCLLLYVLVAIGLWWWLA